MKQMTYKTIFIDRMPIELQEGVLYMAPHFETAMYKCMCGCGKIITTPLTKTLNLPYTWLFDGKNASLYPYYNDKCHSKYSLSHGIVEWC